MLSIETPSAQGGETGEIASPCVRNCCLNENNHCLGCGRSLAEILEWHKADSDRRLAIITHAQNRLGYAV